MKLAQRITRIKPSATLTINTKAQELRAAGRQIVSLAVGEPDFRTPEHICDAAKAAMDQGFTRYTPVPGIPELRTAVAGYFKTFYGVDAAMENVVVTNGGKQSLYNLFQVLLDPGDTVWMEEPGYYGAHAAFLAAGARLEPRHHWRLEEGDRRFATQRGERAVAAEAAARGEHARAGVERNDPLRFMARIGQIALGL